MTRPALTAGTPHYTAREYADLQRYAAARHVTVVPEIDLPGHSAAAVRAYPDLGTLPRPSWYPADAPFPELLAAGHTLARTKALTRFFAPTDGDLDRIVRGGGRVLLSPQSHLYLDRPYDPAIIPPGQAEAGARLGFAYRPRDVRHAASWDPSAYGLAPDRVAGVEATLFAEDFQGFDDHRPFSCRACPASPRRPGRRRRRRGTSTGDASRASPCCGGSAA